MALYKRAGTYYLKFTAPDGTLIRRTTGTTDRQKALEYHDKLKAELWDLAKLKQKPKRTWDEAALRWLKEKAHKKSYRDDVSRIRWFTTHLRGKTLEQVSRDMIDRLISRHFARKSDRTKDLYVALIRAIFRKAMREWEWIAHMPAFKTYARSGKVRVQFLTHDQAAALEQVTQWHQQDQPGGIAQLRGSDHHADLAEWHAEGVGDGMQQRLRIVVAGHGHAGSDRHQQHLPAVQRGEGRAHAVFQEAGCTVSACCSHDGNESSSSMPSENKIVG